MNVRFSAAHTIQVSKTMNRMGLINLFSMSQGDFEVVSHNENGVGDDRKRKKIINFMKKRTLSKALVCLQENHYTLKMRNYLNISREERQTFILPWNFKQQKVCICFRYGLM